MASCSCRRATCPSDLAWVLRFGCQPPRVLTAACPQPPNHPTAQPPHRPANCHVLDAATRMPVGIPPQLQLPASILAAGSAPPLTAAAATCETAEAAPPTADKVGAASVRSAKGGAGGLLDRVAARLLDTGDEDFSTDSNVQPPQQQQLQPAPAPARAEPHYCFVLLTPLTTAAAGRRGQGGEEGELEGLEEEEEGEPRPVANVAGAEAALEAAAAGARQSAKLPPASASSLGSGGGGVLRRRSVEVAAALRPRLSLGSRPAPGSAAAEAAATAAAAVSGNNLPRAAGSPAPRGTRTVSLTGALPAPSSPGLGSSYRPSSQRPSAAATPHGTGGATAGPGGSAAGAQWSYGMSPWPGLVLGHLLGKGGFGRVFAATYRGQRVAAKVSERWERFSQMPVRKLAKFCKTLRNYTGVFFDGD